MGRATTAWRVSVGDALPSQLADAAIDLEKDLEDWLEKKPELLEPGMIILARQLATEGGPLDLLGLDGDGHLAVIELKRGEAYREVVAQVLDYTACIAAWSFDEIRKNVDHNRKQHGLEKTFDELLDAQVGNAEEWVADNPRVLLVGTGADPALRRIVDYLSGDYELPINGVFFDVYADGADGKIVVRSAVLEDDVAAKAGRRGRGGITHEELVQVAQDHGTKEFSTAILAAWKASTGREGRPERKRKCWSLAKKSSGRSVAAWLYPLDEQEGVAWFRFWSDNLADDTGRSWEAVTARIAEVGLQLEEDDYIKLASTADAEKLSALIGELYAAAQAEPVAAAVVAQANGAAQPAPVPAVAGQPGAEVLD